MNLEQHCKETKRILGRSYKEIHEWMDEFSKNYSHSEKYKHRKHRHHLEGAEEAKQKFGNIGKIVAILHIAQDNEGYIPRKKDYEIPEYD